MDQPEYKYDVAFSFVAQDEALAEKLNDLLKGRLKTFMYSERQREVAGTDGEKTFGAVFSKEARVVVVLHRKEWGTTPWTRIEETAIRNRGYEEGYDFAMFIPQDSPPTVPKWLPKNRIWISQERWGSESAAAVIEARVQEAGGNVYVQSAVDRALELSRRLATQKKNEQSLNTTAGVRLAHDEVDSLFEELESVTTELAAEKDAIKLGFKSHGGICRLSGGGYSTILEWQCQYSNSLDGSCLHTSIWKGAVPVFHQEISYSNERTKLGSNEWHLCLSLDGKPQWRESSTGEIVRTADIAKRLLEAHFGYLDEKQE
jgi:hypothetical protein